MKILYAFHRIGYKLQNIQALYYSYLFLSCGKKFKVWGSCHIKNPQNISIGENVSFNDGCYVNGLGGIQIGNNVSISANACIVSTMLDTDCFLQKKKHINKKIIIGNNVQIAAGAIVLPGVCISDNVIVGAGSVVTKDIPECTIVVGNPAKVLKKL